MNDIFIPFFDLVRTFAAEIKFKMSTNQIKNSTMEKLRKLILSFFALLASTMMYAQSEISGTVVDPTGETVIGATVMEKGTSNGTVTDFEGNFKLKVQLHIPISRHHS